jgi:hypothetical protein
MKVTCRLGRTSSRPMLMYTTPLFLFIPASQARPSSL